MLQVAALTRYSRSGASSRVRVLQFRDALREHGVDLEPMPLLDEDYLSRLYGGRRRSASGLIRSYRRRAAHLMRTRSSHLVWIEKEALPWVPAALELRALPRRYVVDIDDAWFHRYGLHPSGLVRASLGGKIGRLLGSAHAVTAGNEYLAEYARRAGATSVTLIPSVVPTERYPLVPTRPSGELTIGWIGSPSTQRYLEALRPALRLLHASGPIRLRVVGGVLAPDTFPIENIPWREDQEGAEVALFDVGVMPLEQGPWEKGKCGYKLIQCMAAGRPVVASPVGANLEIVRDGVDGFFADDVESWCSVLETLRNPELRERMGRAGRARVQARFSVDAVAPLLAEALRSAAGS